MQTRHVISGARSAGRTGNASFCFRKHFRSKTTTETSSMRRHHEISFFTASCQSVIMEIRERSSSPDHTRETLRSHRSMNPPESSDDPVTSDLRICSQRSSSPDHSYVSLKSDRSMGNRPKLSDEAVTSDPRICSQRSSSPDHSCVSLKSDRSMGNRPKLSDEAVTSDPRLRYCGVTDEGCAALASALRSNSSHLRELNLSGNKLGDSGVKRLSPAVLEDPRCKLEILWLRDCGVTDEGCAALASALRSNPSHLRELNLSVNKLGDSGVKRISAVLEDPHCKLEKLWLRDCGVTDEGCSALASALRSNPSHLRELDLSENNLGDSGVKHLCAVLEDPHCKLEMLWLRDCGVTDEGCAALVSALRSNPSHLRELNLIGNKPGDSEVKLLSDMEFDPHYKLEKLYY
uniref:Uncharacterized protein n=1 Tax=Cyprinus carpio carpio TaxID=630221 RepID=A0A9J7Y1L7_CYPCA